MPSAPTVLLNFVKIMEKIIILLVAALCGTSASVLASAQQRIINGQIASNDMFPFSASLQRLSEVANAGRGHRCGAALITLLHALTAASCTYDIVEGDIRPIVASEFRLFAGSSILSNDTTPEHARNIANFTLHPDHIAPPANLNDIAVITLVSPFAATVVTPLALPDSSFQPADLTRCTLAGWGAATIVALNASDSLRFTSKYIYNQGLCTSIFAGMIGVTNVFDTMVCAASFDIISAGCQGDTGSALVCDEQLTGILFLTNNCQSSSLPELYTRVSNYSTWIRSVTGGASSFKPALNILAMLTAVQIVLMKFLA